MGIEPIDIINLIQLRASVSLIGEQSKWWNSSFCGATAKSFLSPVFPRTFVYAQFRGVTASAATVHDERIGVGNVFHLFRLPEGMEQAIHEILQNGEVPEIANILTDKSSALHFIEQFAGDISKLPQGPVRVGNLNDMRASSAWESGAALFYCSGFKQGTETFPFFSNQ
ncbi:MAG: hypothetical protein ZNDK_0520 [Candidatus Desulfovibrio kirbyi]|uniref:BrxE family protein n=1 Tax=Candidatus Desulfovibrio kirbyi TaxID=2696086 RepID=A0A6L2R5D7_9BACT|nr:MAG: hypothetical protein ZNDK_0520 [Candidatus Desulfovibrio kirbyi]